MSMIMSMIITSVKWC